MTFFDELPTENLWTQLTALPEKRSAFEKDLYFREAWADWLNLGGGNSLDSLYSTALLCAKPDAVVGRRLHSMLDYARVHGFKQFHAQKFSFSRHSIRELWRHDWHVYTTDRLAFSTIWYTSCQTVVFLLHNECPVSCEPATVSLCRLKGSASAAARSDDDLRSHLRSPNSVLNFVHVADEPADLLRELAILFDRRDRFEIMRRIIHDQHCDGSATTAEVVTDLENSHPAHDLDLQHSLERLLQARVLQDGDVHQFRQWIKEGVKLPWDSLCAIIDPHAPGVNRWDFITVASELIRLERLNVSGLMPGVVATA